MAKTEIQGGSMARGSSKKGPARATPAKASKANSNGNGANLGFEAQLFLAADKLRKNLEPSDYKHVCLGLIFLKHISNAFEAKRAALLAEDAAAAEDPDEYLAENVFWVPKEARWSHLQANHFSQSSRAVMASDSVWSAFSFTR
jgi:type I restriction enzyme M protein